MSRFTDIADVSFMGDITLAGLKTRAISEYRAAYKELTGEDAAAVPDEIKAILYADAQLLYQSAAAINEGAKQNLLKYASGEYLENLALRYGITRKKGEAAVVSVRFTLSAVRSHTVAIPEGTRVTNASGGAVFATTEYAEITAGNTYADIICRAQSAGSQMNSVAAGEITILADPIAYIGTVSNAAAASGGTDEETDTHLAERIFAARYIYSTTGAKKAYEHFVMSYSTLIKDVIAVCSNDAEIDIYITLTDGTQATEAFLLEIEDYINAPERKPLTDSVSVHNAPAVDYSISMSYSISEDDAADVSAIQAAVAAAAEEYAAWQSSSIGLDIDPQMLISLVRAAGARDITITYPEKATVSAVEIAKRTSTTITYNGLVPR